MSWVRSAIEWHVAAEHEERVLVGRRGIARVVTRTVCGIVLADTARRPEPIDDAPRCAACESHGTAGSK